MEGRSEDLPSAVACLDDDFEACIAHLRFPLGYRRAIRTTNLLERLFGEAGPFSITRSRRRRVRCRRRWPAGSAGSSVESRNLQEGMY
jgi:transposase-like protein